MEVKKEREVAIGIELGLNSSCVSVWQDNVNIAEIIPNDIGKRTTPSCVAFTETDCFVGDAALNQLEFNPSTTFFDLKRLTGGKFDDEDVQRFINLWPSKVVPIVGSSHNKKPGIVISYKGVQKEFQPEEICAIILRKLKEDAEAYLGTEVKYAVITVPAYFNWLQRQAFKKAGYIAGLNVMRIIDEPVAAAVAYGLDKKAASGRRKVLVFDLGRESCEICLASIEKDVFEVELLTKDGSFGSRNIDNRLINFFVGEFKRKHGESISRNPRALTRLRAACEKAKVMLSSCSETTIGIDCLSNGIDFHSSLTRPLFNQLNQKLFERCVSLVKKCLEDAKTEIRDLDEVVLVGGGSRIPMIQQMLEKFFGTKLCNNLHPKEVIACGAAMHAATITTDETDIPVLLKGLDTLLEGFRHFSGPKPIKLFQPHIKQMVVEMLNRLKLDFSDIQLVQSLSLLLREVDSFLPEHLCPALRGLEQTLGACQCQFLERASEKKAKSINLREVHLANAELATSKKMIESSSTQCDRLKAEIAGINATITRLMEKRARLGRDLDAEQLCLVNLSASAATQMEAAKRRLKKVTLFHDSEKLEREARRSLGVAVDCLSSFFESL